MSNNTPTVFEQLEYISDDALLTVPQVAKLIQVSEETVRRWIRSEKLPIYAPTGRYKVQCSDLKFFLKRLYHNRFK